MPLSILDTDHVSLFQRNHPLVTQRVLGIPGQGLAVTIVTVEEQMRGWLNAIRRASSRVEQITAYARLHGAMEYYRTVQLLDFEDSAYGHFTRLRAQEIRIGTLDLRIASIVLAAGGVLITRNVRDFSQVPGLTLENWSAG